MRFMVRAGAILFVVAFVAVGLGWVMQRRLIYLPTGGPEAGSRELPGMERVTFPTEDGLSLAAWFVPAEEVDMGWTIVVFHGNAGNRADRTALAEALAGRGIAVLLVDYRGYGGNPGSPSESGLAADARAAVGYVGSRSDVDPSRVAYFGESLGAAVAVSLAEQLPPAALLLRSPFTSLADAASTHYPLLPMSLLLWDEYPNLETIASINVPTLIVAGSADSIVPVEQSRALFAAAPGPKRLVVIDGADHNDLALTAGEELVDAIVALLAEVPAPGDG